MWIRTSKELANLSNVKSIKYYSEALEWYLAWKENDNQGGTNYFDALMDSREQCERVIALVEEELKNANIQYIDLRDSSIGSNPI